MEPKDSALLFRFYVTEKGSPADTQLSQGKRMDGKVEETASLWTEGNQKTFYLKALRNSSSDLESERQTGR
jgi:hypothetical protein